MTIEEAMHMYEKAGKPDKMGLLETRTKSYVSMYKCENTFNYFYGVIPISTGYLKYFEVLYSSRKFSK